MLPLFDQRRAYRAWPGAAPNRWDWVLLPLVLALLVVAAYGAMQMSRPFVVGEALPVSLDPEAPNRCARWEEFTRQTIQTDGPINQAQEFAGYCLTRHTKYEKCLFLLGPGEDGKSTFLKILQEPLAPAL